MIHHKLSTFLAARYVSIGVLENGKYYNIKIENKKHFNISKLLLSRFKP